MKDPDFDLDDFLPYQFNIIAGRLSRGFAERYKARFGISIAEWRVVAHLHHAGAVSVREIHERAHMDKSKISRAAARLEAAGYITKRVSSVDRRLVELSLTPRGDAMMGELIALARTYQTQIVELLGPESKKVREGINVLMHSRF